MGDTPRNQPEEFYRETLSSGKKGARRSGKEGARQSRRSLTIEEMMFDEMVGAQPAHAVCVDLQQPIPQKPESPRKSVHAIIEL